MSDEQLMRDIPMLDTDRELMREEIEGFDEMTVAQFAAAVRAKTDELLDLMGGLKALEGDGDSGLEGDGDSGLEGDLT